MRYKHLKLSIINWWKIVYLHHLLASILSIVIILHISRSSSWALITQWYTITIIIFSAVTIVHTLVTTVLLIIKQVQQDQRVISKINATFYNEALFKFMKINNHFNFYIINLLNAFALIFTINTYSDSYWSFVTILLLTINFISCNTIAILVWRKSK